jgi:hypothetical protein
LAAYQLQSYVDSLDRYYDHTPPLHSVGNLLSSVGNPFSVGNLLSSVGNLLSSVGNLSEVALCFTTNANSASLPTLTDVFNRLGYTYATEVLRISNSDMP